MKNRLPFLIIFLFTGLTASAQSWLWGVEGITGLKADLFARNVATNSTGNVYHTGGFQSSLTFGSYNLTSSGIDDVYLVKYNQNGNMLWATQSQSPPGSKTFARSVATDDSDNAYLTGYTGDTTIFGTDTLTKKSQGYLVKYNAGGKLMWVKQPGFNTFQNGGYAVATDNFGHEYLAGAGAYLIKFNRNGTILWSIQPTTHYFGSNSINNAGFSVATDSYGNVYMSGEFSGSLTFGNYHLYSANVGAFVAKFDSTGTALWAQQSTHTPFAVGSFNTQNPLYALAVDGSGAAYLTSAFSDTITFGAYTFTTPNDTAFNFFLVKFNPGGTIAWGEEATPVNADDKWGAYSICTDDSEHIYISGAEGQSGQSHSSFSFGDDTITTADNYHDAPSFLLKLDTSGHAICGSTLESGGWEANAVTCDATGKFVYLGGGFDYAFRAGGDSLTVPSGGFVPYVARWQSCAECYFAIAVTSQSQAVCSGQGVTITVIGDSYYTWIPANGLSATTGSSVIATPTLSTIYTIIGNDGTCTGAATDTVIVDATPSLIILPQPPPLLCAVITSDTLRVASEGSDFTWSPSLGLSATTGVSVIASPSVSVTYTVSGIDSLGCPATGTEPVTILQITNQPAFTQYNDTLISTAKHDNQWYRNDTLLFGDTSQDLVITATGNYYDIINNEANGCSTSSDTLDITSLTGINQLTVDNGQVTVYPNPSGGEVHISCAKVIDDIKVTNVLGQVVYESEPKHSQFTFELDDDGVYFVTGAANGEISTSKIIVSK